MFVSTYAGAVAGIDAVKVTVEVNLTGGGLGLYLVGLPDNAVKESEQRIRAAFENTGCGGSGCRPKTPLKRRSWRGSKCTVCTPWAR